MFDERVVLQRDKSTCFAGTACVLMVIGAVNRQPNVKYTFHTDLFVIALITAVITLGFLAWSRLRD